MRRAPSGRCMNGPPQSSRGGKGLLRLERPGLGWPGGLCPLGDLGRGAPQDLRVDCTGAPKDELAQSFPSNRGSLGVWDRFLGGWYGDTGISASPSPTHVECTKLGAGGSRTALLLRIEVRPRVERPISSLGRRSGVCSSSVWRRRQGSSRRCPSPKPGSSESRTQTVVSWLDAEPGPIRARVGSRSGPPGPEL